MSVFGSTYLILFFVEAGGRKFSPDTTFLPVFASSASLASFAIFPPFFPATAFSRRPSALSLSAICLVDNSASAVKISSASVIWSLRFWAFSPLTCLCFWTVRPVHSSCIMLVSRQIHFLVARRVLSNSLSVCFGYPGRSSAVVSIFHFFLMLSSLHFQTVTIRHGFVPLFL